MSWSSYAGAGKRPRRWPPLDRRLPPGPKKGEDVPDSRPPPKPSEIPRRPEAGNTLML